MKPRAAKLAAELDAWLDRALGPGRAGADLLPADRSRRSPIEDPWRVEFALQSTEDPSLMVPAADICSATPWAGHGFGPGGDDPVEEACWPGWAPPPGGCSVSWRNALREPAAGLALELDTSGAFRFLKETGPLLAGAGFGVLGR